MHARSNASLANVINALAHRSRILVFRTMLGNPSSGNSFAELAMATKLCDSSLIHHLRVMEQGGVIKRRKIGAVTEYKLALSPLRNNLELILSECGAENAHKTAKTNGTRIGVLTSV